MMLWRFSSLLASWRVEAGLGLPGVGIVVDVQACVLNGNGG